MVVRIRFGRGPVVSRRKGKNSRIALLGASSLTLVSICLGSLGFWRLSQDVGLAGDFVISDGFLSHWQVWIGSAVVLQYGAWRLNRYARQSREHAMEPATVEASQMAGGVRIGDDSRDASEHRRVTATL
ncbi:MAG: hypothetical protein ABJC09_02630 [Terriglobia bacterium]